MEKYTKHFEMFPDLQSELLTQQFIIDYIESTFFEKLKTVKTILSIDIDEDLIYSDNQRMVLFLNESIDNKIEELEKSQVKFLEIPDWVKSIHKRSDIGELIQGIRDMLNELDYESDESIIEAIKSNITNNYDFIDAKDRISFTDAELIKSLDVAKIISNNEQFYENENNLEMLLTFKPVLRLLDYKSFSNIYRQLFINIFSIFDASVFDILKEYFNKNINELEIFFNPNNSKTEKQKLSFDELLKFNDIDSLHYEMINTRFSGIYISSIMRHIKNFRDDFFDESLDFSKLLETINRRNIHIHNKGIVDNKYVEDINPYSYKLGDTAFITREYLYNTFELFSSLESKLINLNSIKNKVTNISS